MRKFVIGDVCGEIDLLKSLMDRIAPTADDYLLFTGSYLGPGKDSKAVLDYLIDLKEKINCNFLQGCYETVFQQILGKPDKNLQALWKSMGGDRVLQSYAVKEEFKIHLEGGKIGNFTMPFAIPEPHIRFLEKNLHLWYMDHVYPFVVFHAGPDTKSFMNPSQEAVILGENGWWESSFRLHNLDIVFGHIPFKEPFRAPGKRGVHLGCGMGGDKLCAWEASSDEFVVVKSREAMVTVQ